MAWWDIAGSSERMYRTNRLPLERILVRPSFQSLLGYVETVGVNKLPFGKHVQHSTQLVSFFSCL